MKRAIPLGTYFGLRTTISPAGLAAFILAVPAWGWLAAWLLRLELPAAALAGALASVIAFVSEWLHQAGHALAARRTGYPMTGIHFYPLLSASQYPADEPPLPPQTHIRRALGGFWVNVLIGLACGALALSLWPRGGLWAWAAGFSAGWNLLVLGLGALLPIDIPGVLTVDGGTILRYWRESRKTDKDG